MKVIVSIPAFNEERTIGRIIEEIKEIMNSTSHKYDILVVNDGSRDRTEEVAKEAGAIVVNNKRNMGLAETFKREMIECLKRNADVIVHTDADGQYPSIHIPEMIKKIEKGYDLIMGSRFKGGQYSGSLANKIGNVAFAKVFSKLLKQRIKVFIYLLDFI